MGVLGCCIGVVVSVVVVVEYGKVVVVSGCSEWC